MDQSEVIKKLGIALSKLFSNDKFLFENKAHERSITHKLALYLEKRVTEEELDVDVEYNLAGGSSPKDVVLESLPHDCWGDLNPDDANAKTVYPDIIIHKRGTSNKNILALEVKKSTNTDGCDKEKLNAYKSLQNFDYEHAIFLKLLVGEQSTGIVEATLQPSKVDISNELREWISYED